MMSQAPPEIETTPRPPGGTGPVPASRRAPLGDDRHAAADQAHRHHPRPRGRAVDDVDEPEAVRPGEDHAVLAAEVDELLLRARAGVADLAEACREHDGVPDP